MKKQMSPYLVIILSFLAVIVIGTVLLILPISTLKDVNISFVDALFTSTSAVTITGITPVNINNTFSLFGKIVMVLLFQIGGLSVTTITLFILTIIGSKISMSKRQLAKESVNVDSVSGIVKMIKRIVILALVIELIGSLIFVAIFLANGFDFKSSLGMGLFHAISSYNNAGFDIFPNLGLLEFKDNILFNLVTMLLVTLGGFGAIVIYDIIEKKRYKKLSFHSKIVLKISLFLFVIGTILFFLLDKDVTILEAMFHSTAVRSSGFDMINFNSLLDSTKFLMLIFMFIGTAPASTGGGLKITTFYTIFKTGSGFIEQKTPTAYKRKIPYTYQIKAFMILFFSSLVVVISVFLLSLIENKLELSNIIFEVINTFTNTGFNTGIILSIKIITKLLFIVLMLIGRIGILTFISATGSKARESSAIEYIDINYLI